MTRPGSRNEGRRGFERSIAIKSRRARWTWSGVPAQAAGANSGGGTAHEWLACTADGISNARAATRRVGRGLSGRGVWNVPRCSWAGPPGGGRLVCRAWHVCACMYLCICVQDKTPHIYVQCILDVTTWSGTLCWTSGSASASQDQQFPPPTSPSHRRQGHRANTQRPPLLSGTNKECSAPFFVSPRSVVLSFRFSPFFFSSLIPTVFFWLPSCPRTCTLWQWAQ